MGLLVGGLHWRRARRRQDVHDGVVVRVAVHISLALAIASLVLVVIGVLSMGMALLPPVVLGVLGAGLAGGLVMALLPWRRTRRGTDASTPSEPQRGVPDEIAAQSPAVLEYEPTRIVAHYRAVILVAKCPQCRGSERPGFASRPLHLRHERIAVLQPDLELQRHLRELVLHPQPVQERPEDSEGRPKYPLKRILTSASPAAAVRRPAVTRRTSCRTKDRPPALGCCPH